LTAFWRSIRGRRFRAIGRAEVNAGHDLNSPIWDILQNSRHSEVSIGHALIADALDLGLANAVRAYLRIPV
jgi:pyridoxine 5-phosphate synthase